MPIFLWTLPQRHDGSGGHVDALFGALKDRARAMVREDRERTLMLIRAWLSADLDKNPSPHMNASTPQPIGADRG